MLDMHFIRASCKDLATKFYRLRDCFATRDQRDMFRKRKEPFHVKDWGICHIAKHLQQCPRMFNLRYPAMQSLSNVPPYKWGTKTLKPIKTYIQHHQTWLNSE